VRLLPPLVALALTGAMVTAAAATELTITTADTAIPLDGHTGAGFQPGGGDGTLDSDVWWVTGLSDGDLTAGATATGGDYARGTSTGGVSSGGIYAFSVLGTLPTIGWQAAGSDMTPGAIVFAVRNGTGGRLSELTLSADIYVLNNEDRSTSVVAEWSLDGASWSGLGAGLMTAPTASATPSWEAVAFEAHITADDGFSVAAGERLLVRFLTDDAGGSGSRDELAIANPSVTVGFCGDGETQAGEECDGDLGCNAACAFSSCGDSVVDDGEDCDDGGESADCDADCTLPGCGDGTTNFSAGEACDPGAAGETEICDSDCTLPVCGDFVANAAADEACDPGPGVLVDTSIAGDNGLNAGGGLTRVQVVTLENDTDVGAVEAMLSTATCVSLDLSIVALDDDGAPDLTAVLATRSLTDVPTGWASIPVSVSLPAGQYGLVFELEGCSIRGSSGDRYTGGSFWSTTLSSPTLVEIPDQDLNVRVDTIAFPNETASCNIDCTAAVCGDTYVNAAAGEECDAGEETESCDSDCTAVTCGDGVLNATAGEACDDGDERVSTGTVTEALSWTVEGLAVTGAGLVLSTGSSGGTIERFDPATGDALGTFIDGASLPGFEDCVAGDDADGDLLFGCDDPDCASTSTCVGGGEVCDNGGDDDGDGAADCDDPDCAGQATCRVTLTAPSVMAVAADGSLLVAQTKSAPVYRFDGDTGAFLGVAVGARRNWLGLTVDAAGAVYGATSDRVYSFDPDGTPSGTLIDSGVVFFPGQLAVAPDGGLYLTALTLLATGNGGLFHFDASGAFVDEVTSGFNYPGGAGRAPDGDLVCTTKSARVLCYDVTTHEEVADMASSFGGTLGQVFVTADTVWAVTGRSAERFRLAGNNDARADACRTSCALPTCGDGAVDSGEDCDEMMSSYSCDADCSAVVCGDGTVNGDAGEWCDVTEASADCDADCSAAFCGDGVVNASADETCDAGATLLVDTSAGGDGVESDQVSTSRGQEITLAAGAELGTLAVELTASAACAGARVRLAAADADDGHPDPGILFADTTITSFDRETSSGELAWYAVPVDASLPAGAYTVIVSADPGVDCSWQLSLNAPYGGGSAWTTGEGVAGWIAVEDGAYHLRLSARGDTTECDGDCTAVSCGDGYVNPAAGEDCDAADDTADCDGGCTAVICGDGYTNTVAGEACDDGLDNNDTLPDACRTSCELPSCGDGAVDSDETCDDGAANSDVMPDVCRLDCTPARCGDDVIDSDESCDDGGESGSCNADCTTVSCGDGKLNVTSGETCDEGGETETCNGDCTEASCGDGKINAAAGETCDDSGESADCNDDCTPASCGDGKVNASAGETCDTSGASDTCDSDCTAPECGDELVNTAAGEACDDGGESEGCNADCSVAECGDGKHNATAGEACDTAGDSMGCDADCTAVECGDDHVNSVAGEVCDDGGESESCNGDCTAASCGDGKVNATAGEACDTAGASETCDADCSPVVCGDGHVNEEAGEACDDSNTVDGDGCSSSCQLEGCGDDVKQPSEGCDDGNTEDGDGCDASCVVEECGNGKLQSGEDCDTGGVDTESCDSDCTVPSCGDGHANAEAGEACDDGGESATCDSDCTAVECGDGVANAAAGEACDTAGESATCDDDCTAVECGDSIANHEAGEACDDGGESSHCDDDCTLRECGDGTINESAGEVCDDGGESAACNHDCTPASCGDGVPNATAGEECDDRGESATCNADCTLAVCGDGIVNKTASESCDGTEGCGSDCTTASTGGKSGGCQGGEEAPAALALMLLAAWALRRRRRVVRQYM